MSAGMLQLMLLAIVLAIGTIFIVIGGRRADRARSGRFSDRDDVSFDRFYAFAKRHEETHRAIWLQCAAEAEALAGGVAAATCAEGCGRAPVGNGFWMPGMGRSSMP